MTRWYRAYQGTVTDAKFGEVALVAGCSRSVAIACWHAILESCAETNDGGRFNATPRRIAVILGEPIAIVEAIFGELQAMDMICGSAVLKWEKRQFASDSSTERSRKHRQHQRNGDATLQQQDATPPEREADTEAEIDASLSREPEPLSKFKQEIVDAYLRARSMHTPDTHHAEIWLRRGYDPAICLSVIKSTLTKKPNVPLKYFDGGIADAHLEACPHPGARAGPHNSQTKRTNVAIAVEKALERERAGKHSNPNARTSSPAGGSGVVVDAEPGSWVAG